MIQELQTIWEGLDFSYLLSILMSLIPALICITVHELCHGLAAYAQGDDTAKKMGRLSLNPVKHLDMMGLLMMLVFRVGWAKPVPINMYRFKNPKAGMAITALAGPVSNVLLALVFLFLFGLCYIPFSAGAVGLYVLEMLQLAAYLSLGLAVFNLLPIPPLDGSKVLFACLTDEQYDTLMRYEKYGMIAMLLLMASGVLGQPLSRLISWLFGLFFPVAQWGIELSLLFL